MTGLDPRRPQDPPFVPWEFPEHDDAVRGIVEAAHAYGVKMGLPYGVGVIDFADGTVVVLSKTVPVGETFQMLRKDENHILAGYGTNPFENAEKAPDFTENLVEIKNPHATNTVIGVDGIKK